MLEVLSGVRYYVVPSGNSGLRPYGYNVCINCGTLGAGGQYEVKCDAYENDSVLPLGFASDAVIPRSTYEELDVTKKQQALLQIRDLLRRKRKRRSHFPLREYRRVKLTSY